MQQISAMLLRRQTRFADRGWSRAMREVVHLARLAARGILYRTVCAEARGILSRWRSERLCLYSLRERLEVLQADVDKGFVAAEESLLRAETPEERRKAVTQIDALHAIRIEVELEFRSLGLIT